MNYFKITTILSLAGTLFAGYLSAVKIFSNSCALGETCPYFLGYPACWFGFGFFSIMLISSIIGLFVKYKEKLLNIIILAVSTVGILFAGNFVLQEVTFWMSHQNTSYKLILPTCVYGLIFYILIFIFSLNHLTKSPKQSSTN